jgi:hypothetical protein
VTAPKSWPNSRPMDRSRGRQSDRSTDWIEYAHLAASDNRSEQTADGRMATEAARLEPKNSPKLKKNCLDPNRPSHGRSYDIRFGLQQHVLTFPRLDKSAVFAKPRRIGRYFEFNPNNPFPVRFYSYDVFLCKERVYRPDSIRRAKY